jgi:hypothetical protein
MSLIPDDNRSGIIFDSIVWRGDFMVEVSYTEERNRGDGVCQVTTLVVDRRKLAEQYRSFIEALVDIVDEGEVVLLNPPEQISRQGNEDVSSQ